MAASVHPMHGPNKFKLGVFSMNSDGGLTLTKVPERWPAIWSEIVGAQIRIERQDRNAERVEREPVPEELRPVLEQQRHTGAVAIARCRVGGAQRLGA